MQTRSNLFASARGHARILGMSVGLLAAGALVLLACSRGTGTGTSDNGPDQETPDKAGAAKRAPGTTPTVETTRGDMDTWQIVKNSVAPEAGVAYFEQVTVPGFDLFWVSVNRPNASHAVAVSTSDGKLLTGKDAVRSILHSGYRDATGLAHVALIFLERGGELVDDAPATLDGNRLVYRCRNSAMETLRSEVDLDTLAVTSTPVP